VYLTKHRIDKIIRTLEKFRVKLNDSRCYGWSGAIRTNGFPKIYVEGRSIGAHRATWMVTHGKIPEHHYVRHTCDNKHCTNPNHLFTSKDRSSKKLPEERKSFREGRERLNVDLPTRLVKDVKKMALKYHQTVTKYVGKRLSEIVAYEKRLEKDSR
jgi:hypothetical protein